MLKTVENARCTTQLIQLQGRLYIDLHECKIDHRQKEEWRIEFSSTGRIT